MPTKGGDSMYRSMLALVSIQDTIRDAAKTDEMKLGGTPSPPWPGVSLRFLQTRKIPHQNMTEEIEGLSILT